MELIAAIMELKRRNPKFGCVRIAQQISHVFGVDIDKDVVRRVLAKHYRPGGGDNSPGQRKKERCRTAKTTVRAEHVSKPAQS